MKKINLIFLIIVFLICFNACGTKSKETIDNNINDEEITTLTPSIQSNNSKNELQDVEEQIQIINDKINSVKIVFASSTIESSSLDIVIVSLTTIDNYKVTEDEKKSIKKIIKNSIIKDIISYKDIEIYYY